MPEKSAVRARVPLETGPLYREISVSVKMNEYQLYEENGIHRPKLVQVGYSSKSDRLLGT